MKRMTREWVRKAEDDHRAAGALGRADEPLHDQVCFHCQQSAEKYLKAVLEEQGESVPKTHDLEALLNRLTAAHPGLGSLRRGVGFLTTFAVDSRYPGNRATKRKATSALRWMAKVRAACRPLLALDPP